MSELASAHPLLHLPNHSVVVVPGLGGSGPAHWQTHWEQAFPGWIRCHQNDWDHPSRDAWIETLSHTVASTPLPVVLVGHSLGVATIAHAAAAGLLAKVERAFLVAMPDIERADFPMDLCPGFSPMPRVALPFRATMVGSTNDPWITPERLRHFATILGATYVDVGQRHHIGTHSGLGAWEEGLKLFEDFLAH